eukprot:gene29498-38601_t
MKTPLENIESGTRIFFEVKIAPSSPPLWSSYEILEDSVDSTSVNLTLFMAPTPHKTGASIVDPAKRLLSYLESHPNPSNSDCGQLKLDLLLHRKERELNSIQKWLQL